jgi:hypothetical protein
MGYGEYIPGWQGVYPRNPWRILLCQTEYISLLNGVHVLSARRIFADPRKDISCRREGYLLVTGIVSPRDSSRICGKKV